MRWRPIRHSLGLLSYALVRDGLESNLADYKPKDGKILLSEWLSYVAEDVPKLYFIRSGETVSLEGE